MNSPLSSRGFMAMVKTSLPRPCNCGFREAICITGQHGRVANVGSGVHLGVSYSYSGNDWGKRGGLLNAEYNAKQLILSEPHAELSCSCSVRI